MQKTPCNYSWNVQKRIFKCFRKKGIEKMVVHISEQNMQLTTSMTSLWYFLLPYTVHCDWHTNILIQTILRMYIRLCYRIRSEFWLRIHVPVVVYIAIMRLQNYDWISDLLIIDARKTYTNKWHLRSSNFPILQKVWYACRRFVNLKKGKASLINTGIG